MKKFILLLIIITFSLCGCETSNQSYNIDELEFKLVAWNSLDEHEKELIIRDINDIEYVKSDNSRVETVVNNAPADVWKESSINIVESKYYTYIETKREELVVVNFKTLFDTEILRYIDPISKKVIYKDVRGLKNISFDLKHIQDGIPIL